ncbi:hypothetical protein [Dactylosporangium sp. NPDC051541]|uniref:hypothetical protein n=1 Tax=Dactylosporangium sp. NPDC051541 TaxID=3363977 RepID=UPI003788FB21
MRDTMHRLLHRIPGVPEHTENQPHKPHAHAPHSHAAHSRSPHNDAAHDHSPHSHSPHGNGRTRNHTADRPPRILPAWQRRIAALFGRDLP